MTKKIVIITAIISIISSICFSKEKPHQYKVEKIFTDMRNLAFIVKPAGLNIKQEKQNQIYGVFMETGYEEAVLSLRCFADGTINIYFSKGGGTTGIGDDKAAGKSGLDFIKEADDYLSRSKLTTDYKLPDPGKTIFYILTSNGVYTYECLEKDLEKNKSEFSPLFFRAQDVITRARILDEKRSSGDPYIDDIK